MNSVFTSLKSRPGVYWGQKGEDYHIHKHYFPTLRYGTFLEMGALDGVIYSNTKFFEDTMNWSGVLIEPIPSEFAKLKVNRPRCTVVNCAVSTREGMVDMYSNQAVSSVKENTSDDFYKTWHDYSNVKLIQVPSRRLDTILHAAGVKQIDFWSLDVEGSELEALQTMDWSIPVKLICIEKQLVKEQEDACTSILSNNGFIKTEEYEHNEIWVSHYFRR